MIKKISTICFVLIANYSFSQWNFSPAVNNAACVQPYEQINVKLVSDLNGGTIIVWEDYRNDTTNTVADIYAQRINSSGNIMWPANGVIICNNAAHQFEPVIVSDSLGGAIIAWEDKRGLKGNLYAQRIDSSGNVLWATNGVGVSPRNFEQKNAKIITDASSGAVILWQDSIGGAYDIYGQRIDNSGTPLWSTGVSVCTMVLAQVNPKAQINAAGDIYVTWQDKRLGADYDIYAQKLNLAGAAQWTANGISVCNIAGTQSNPKIVIDAGGIAIITWQDKRTGLDYNVYAQQVNSAGAMQWTPNGVLICNASGNQSGIDITAQNISNGAIITWKDGRLGTANIDIYAQMISLSGVVQWAANGIAVSNLNFNQVAPNITGDGNGGAIISFQDSSSGNWDIKSQRLSPTGTLLWNAAGVDIGNAIGDQTNISNIETGFGNSIYTFQDMRSGNTDTYAYKIDINGNPIGISQINANKDALRVFPNPSCDKVTFALPTTNEKWTLITTGIDGNEIMREEIKNSDKYKLTKKLEVGIYFYSIQSTNFSSKGKFVIIN